MTELLIDLALISPFYARALGTRWYQPARFHRVLKIWVNPVPHGQYRAVFACGRTLAWLDLPTREPDKAHRCKRCWT